MTKKKVRPDEVKVEPFYVPDEQKADVIVVKLKPELKLEQKPKPEPEPKPAPKPTRAQDDPRWQVGGRACRAWLVKQYEGSVS